MPDLTQDQKWEMLKASGIEISKFEFHQAAMVFTSTTKTVGAFKPGLRQGLKNIKMWRTASCYLLEMDGQKQIVELAAVAASWPI